MTVNLNLTGAGTVGGILPGWRVQEDATPVAPGDSSGSVGQVSLTMAHGEDSEFILDNDSVFVHDRLGSIPGKVLSLGSDGATEATDTTLGVNTSTPLTKLAFERTAHPVGTHFLDYAGIEDVGYPVDMEPVGIASHSDGSTSYLIAGSGNPAYIKKISPASVTTVVPITAVTNNNQMALAVDSSNNYYTVNVFYNTGSGNTETTIRKYAPTGGAPILTWGSIGSGNGQFAINSSWFYNPLHFSDYTGTLFVADYSNSRVQEFTTAGVFVRAFAAFGPLSVTTGPNNIYTSHNNPTLPDYRKWTLTGTAVSTSPISGTLDDSPYDIAVSNDGQSLFSLRYSYVTSTAPQYSLIRIDTGTLREVDITRVTGKIARTISVGRVFMTLLINDPPTYSTITGGPSDRYIYANTTARGAVAYYLALVGIYTSIYAAQEQANFSMLVPGWAGNVWDKLKQFCTVHNVQIDVINGIITVNPVGVRIIPLDNVASGSVNLTVSGQSPAVALDITYQNPSVVQNQTIYDSAVAGQVLSVDVGQTTTQTIKTQVYSAIINQPIGIWWLAGVFPGNFTVIDSSSPPMNMQPVTYQELGMSVYVAQNIDDPMALDVTLTGPAVTVPGTVGPYRLASAVGSVVTPSFSVTGDGLRVNPDTLTLLTGAAENKPHSEKGPASDSPFMDTLTRAYDRGVWASQPAAGPEITLTLTLPTSVFSGFGLISGSRVTFKESIYRIVSARVGNATTDLTLARHISVNDWIGYGGYTTGQFDTFWAANQVGDFTIKPLRAIV